MQNPCVQGRTYRRARQPPCSRPLPENLATRRHASRWLRRLSGMRDLVAKYGEHMQPHLVDAIKGRMTDVQITDAMVARKKITNQSWRFMRKYDLLLTPTIAVAPFKQGIQGPETIEGKKADPFQWIAFT
jgi:Asp-tRNA(Asn)/Glu-tRNA(Gln) amidotransferase A subunit family amidase